MKSYRCKCGFEKTFEGEPPKRERYTCPMCDKDIIIPKEDMKKQSPEKRKYVRRKK